MPDSNDVTRTNAASEEASAEVGVTADFAPTPNHEVTVSFPSGPAGT